MGNLKLRILLPLLLAAFGVFIAPPKALAVVQNLNGQTGQTQTFQNDTNVIINSLNNIHSLGWQGLLPVSRGGTGASSFTAGSLLFFNGTTFAQNNSNLFWDNINNRLGIGTSSPTSAFDVNGNTSISGNLNVTGNITSTNLVPYTGATQAVDLGSEYLIAGNLYARGGVNAWNNGGFALYSDSGSTEVGSISNNGQGLGIYAFSVDADNLFANLDFKKITSIDKTFTFPDASGTFGLLEANQTWSGLNKFEASTNSTIYVGSSVRSGCIAMGDSDGSGITYVTVNDGVLTASTTKPSICQ